MSGVTRVEVEDSRIASGADRIDDGLLGGGKAKISSKWRLDVEYGRNAEPADFHRSAARGIVL